MDDSFGGGDGFRVLEAIRPLPKRLRTIMIVGNESGIERSMNLGAQDYATKPLSIPRFLSQIRRILWQREDSRSHARMTIMVVDHEIPQLLISGTALHQLGECQVLLAHGARDALQRLAHTQPHYMVLDMNMPGTSGEEFLKSIPGWDWLRGLEIIMATPAGITPPLPPTSRKILGAISHPYQPVKFIKEVRALIPALQDETLIMPPVDHSLLEAEVQRILTLQAVPE